MEDLYRGREYLHAVINVNFVMAAEFLKTKIIIIIVGFVELKYIINNASEVGFPYVRKG